MSKSICYPLLKLNYYERKLYSWQGEHNSYIHAIGDPWFTYATGVGPGACCVLRIHICSRYLHRDYGGTAVTAVQADDGQSAALNLGFIFNFCGVDYTQVRANSNGWLTFGPGTTDQAVMRENNTTNLNTLKPLLMALWDDMDGFTGAGSYTTTGAAPNRIFTFQWKNWEWNWLATGPNISFQIKLYEGTNVIEYVYRQESAAGSPGDRVVRPSVSPTVLQFPLILP